jgi:hypothetical protein
LIFDFKSTSIVYCLPTYCDLKCLHQTPSMSPDSPLPPVCKVWEIAKPC